VVQNDYSQLDLLEKLICAMYPGIAMPKGQVPRSCFVCGDDLVDWMQTLQAGTSGQFESSFAAPDLGWPSLASILNYKTGLDQ